MSKPLSKHQLQVTRAKADEFKVLMAKGQPETVERVVQLAAVSGWLATAVPHLLDEIERLQATGTGKRATPSTAFIKFDGRGGNA